MKKIWVPLFTLLFVFSNTYAQEVASFQAIQNKEFTTGQKIELLVQQAETYAKQKDFHSAIESLSNAMDLNKISDKNQDYLQIIQRCLEKKVFNEISEDNVKLIIRSLKGKINTPDFFNLLATETLYAFKSEFAIELAQKALTISRLTKDKQQESIALYRIGRCYFKFRAYDKTAPYFLASLKIKRSLADSVGMIKNLINLGHTYNDLDRISKSLEYMKEALLIAYAIKDLHRALDCLWVIRDNERFKGNYKKVQVLEKQIREIVEVERDSFELTRTKLGEARTLKNMGNYKEALPLFQECLEWETTNGSNRSISRLDGRLAECFLNLGVYDTAIIYFQKSIHYAPERNAPLFSLYSTYKKIGDQKTALKYLYQYQNKVNLLSNSADLLERYDFYNMKSKIFYETLQLDSAIYYTKKNIAFIEQNELLNLLIPTKTDLGRFYKKQGDLEIASKYFQEALVLSRKMSRSKKECEIILFLTELAIEQDENEKAIIYANECLDIAKEFHQFGLLGKIYTTLSKANEKIGDFEKALNYQKMSKTLKDSLLGFAQYSQIIHYEAKFNIQEKEKENQQLRLAQEHSGNMVKKRTNIILCLTISIFFLLLINYYIKERAKLKVKNTLRQQLAKDIHDDIGGIINNLKRTAKEALEKKSDSALVEKKLTQTIQLGNEAMTSLKDLIWKLEKEETVLGQLEKEIIALTEKVFSLHQITYQLNITGFKMPQPLTANFYNHLMMIYKEILQNIVKHGDNEQVIIVWKYENMKMILIAKNLIPIPANSDKNHFMIHRGLENIKKRAVAINGRVTLKKISNFFELNLELNIQ